MALAVAAGAVLTCPFGSAPGQLMVTSQYKVLAEGRPVATGVRPLPIHRWPQPPRRRLGC